MQKKTLYTLTMLLILSSVCLSQTVIIDKN